MDTVSDLPELSIHLNVRDHVPVLLTLPYS
jgi:hypothetical protein